MKYLRIHNVSMHIKFYHNRFINRNTFRKFPYRRKDRGKDVVFFARCRRTYAMNIQEKYIPINSEGKFNTYLNNIFLKFEMQVN